VAARVVSASRRTDVPAFHHRWLIDRLREGWCEVRHPFTGVRSRVDLSPEAVIALVMWTRDPRPLLPHLDELADRGYPATFLVTVNGYPDWLEPGAPDLDGVVGAMAEIRHRLGPDALVWRYDPVVLTTATPPSYHLDRVGALGRRLQGITDGCITSFVDLYRKTERNLVPAAAAVEADLLEPDPDCDRELVVGMRDTLTPLGIELAVCCEKELLDLVPRAHCVDRDRIGRLLGRPVKLPARPTRAGCGCHASVDIGAYDTCPRGCVYCYANQSPRSGKVGAGRGREDGPALG